MIEKFHDACRWIYCGFRARQYAIMEFHMERVSALKAVLKRRINSFVR